MMKRKTEISVETEESVFYRTRRSFTGFCKQCDMPVEMLAPEVAAIISALSEREIFRLIENDEIHFIESGRIFICLNSLPVSKE